ncbi:hypothetical protein NDU88_011320 [Pleurodeles waltl]|uniref:Uncharacterized protein n=1 Tax=Pleurodeles waltl TaxID=8319 RepID=A0AAV7S3T6_PLEWA|nr:hypothetical protein NDU88_011320 [Pleurodeles waltl]
MEGSRPSPVGAVASGTPKGPVFRYCSRAPACMQRSGASACFRACLRTVPVLGVVAVSAVAGSLYRGLSASGCTVACVCFFRVSGSVFELVVTVYQ